MKKSNDEIIQPNEAKSYRKNIASKDGYSLCQIFFISVINLINKSSSPNLFDIRFRTSNQFGFIEYSKLIV